MNRRTRIGVGIAGGAAAAVAAAAIAIALPASADESASADQSPSATSSAPAYPGGRGSETLLTGTDAEKATTAALAAVEGGTVLRVETDADGGGTYEAHVRKADGTEVVVLMDDDFAVTSVEEFTGGGRGGHGRGPGGAGPGETLLTGTDAEKATAAAQAAVEGGTVLRVETDADGGGTYEAHVRKADGTEVVVLMDGDFSVTSVQEFTGGPGARGGPDDGGTADRGTSGSTTTPTASPSASA